LARGRDHQSQDRPADAMLCFRRAVREDPQSAKARFRLGQVLWQLGRQADAIAVWRDATQTSSKSPRTRQALAEALITTGDVAGAKDVAESLLQSNPNDAWARAITAVAALSEADDEAAARTVADLVTLHPELLTVSIAIPLARAIERRPAFPGSVAILDALIGAPPDAARVAAMPATLVALAAERLAAATAIAPAQRQPWIGRFSRGHGRRAITTRSAEWHSPRLRWRLITARALPSTMRRCASAPSMPMRRLHGRNARAAKRCGSSCS
jgi:tetratricopeptide (TPR) repeat protein